MKRKIATGIFCLTLIMIIAIAAGCSKKAGDVVAKVGDREIMMQDIDNFIDRSGLRFVSADKELELKRSLLDTLINQQLLIIGAYEHNLENQEEVLKVVDGEKDKFLLDVLFEDKILSRATPSEAEIKDWYSKMGQEIKASHILVKTEDEAREIIAELKNGANFEELAVSKSIDPSAQRNQGDLGWFTWGAMVDNFQEAAYKMKPGEISAPVKSEFGYHIIKVVDRRDVEHRLSYAESKANIKNLITERRKRTLMREYADELKKKYPITVEKPTCEFVLNKLEYLYPDTIGNRPRWRNNIDPQQLDKDERALPIGRYDGGQLTLGEYITNLQRIPPQYQPDFDKYDSLSELIFQMSFMNILTLEAKASKLESSDKYINSLTKFKEKAMADVMRFDSIPYAVDINDGEIQEYYDTHLDEFTTPLRFHLYEIRLDDKGMALKYKSTINNLTAFKNIAARETLNPGKKQVSGDLGLVIHDQYPDLFEAAESLKSGKIAGPVQIAGKWSIVWVAERLEPEVQDFDLAKRRIIDEVTRAKGDELYDQWIDNMKKRINVQINEDVLTNSIDMDKYQEPDSLTTG